MRDIIGNEHKFFEAILLKRIDLCHIFWREDLFHLFNPIILKKAAQNLGMDGESIARAINSCAFTTSVYDHLFTTPEEMSLRRPGYTLIDGYTVSSEKLRAIYSQQSDIPAPDLVIPDGVDIDHFTPAETTRADSGEYTVGWVGNSAWGKKSGLADVKGHQKVFSPMIDALGQRGLRVKAQVADPQVSRVDFADMPDFYRGLDVFTCTSRMEGTPNTVLEAMACGLPIVSTNVGIVPEAFGTLQRRFIIEDGDSGSFADAVEELLRDPKLRIALGRENRKQALEWSWEKTTSAWWPYWKNVANRNIDPRYAGRRELCLRLLAHW